MDSQVHPLRIAVDYSSGWDRIQRALVRTIAPLTIEQLRFTSSQKMWNVGTLAAHIAIGRARWWNTWMREGGDEIASLIRLDAVERTAAQLVAAHELTSLLIGDCLVRWADHELETEFGNPAQPERGLRTRRWIIWHVLEHDLFHAGEISQILGSHGLTGVDISDRRPSV